MGGGIGLSGLIHFASNHKEYLCGAVLMPLLRMLSQLIVTQEARQERMADRN
ncbi:hypothetical protein APS_1829 [Acetobacter pasteurianus subsp. pasteurianus LMG 1262 = NBRC 106471]|nr:hypothetical protein APS_1829 [Acetobacter pasteurianus subsp. pasteurianus LMG 1262 = NBRC 106471]